MTSQQLFRAILGIMVGFGALLSGLVHPGWAWFTFFIAFMLFQSACTNFCPLQWIIDKTLMKE